MTVSEATVTNMLKGRFWKYYFFFFSVAIIFYSLHCFSKHICFENNEKCGLKRRYILKNIVNYGRIDADMGR